MRTLVTGGAGFIGSNLVDALLDAGHEVVVVDDLSTGREENLRGALGRGAELVVADVTDTKLMMEMLRRRPVDTIFHLAAQIDVRRAVAEPGFDAHVNVEGTISLLEAARETGVGRFVFVSTGGAIYGEGEGQELPFGEDAEIAPMTPYGQSKFAAEGYVALYAREHGLSGVSLRLANVYGPRQDPLGEAGVVAIFCGKLAAGEQPTVFGSGEQTRDFVYVGDVVQALLAAADSDATGAYNIGAGVETSVLGLLEALHAAGAAPQEPIFEEERPGEVQRISLDPTLASEALGWRPLTSLTEGIKKTYAATGDPTSSI
jgi:UDP-glucose 4-epimerase